jgi:hypothetical protein
VGTVGCKEVSKRVETAPQRVKMRGRMIDSVEDVQQRGNASICARGRRWHALERVKQRQELSLGPGEMSLGNQQWDLIGIKVLRSGGMEVEPADCRQGGE